MPLAPRLAHMVARGGERAARIAALLTERGLGGADADLRHRLETFARDRSPRANDARALAARWARGVKDEGLDEASLLALAYPERVARARGKPGEFQLVTGRGVFVEPTDALARETWLAVGELGGGATRDRILLAAPLTETDVLAVFANDIVIEDRVGPDEKGKIQARRVRRLGRLIIDEKIVRADPQVIRAALIGQVRDQGLSALPLGEASNRLRERLTFIGEPLTDEVLAARLNEWLDSLLSNVTRLEQLSDGAIAQALLGLVPWEVQRRLDAEAPQRFTAPTGNSFAIDYSADSGPRVEVRVGELYGLAVHPTVAGVPLTLSLLSPAHRPIQTTKDLPGFWKGSWSEVRKDMRGRYPRHVWPEDPAAAAPVTRAKPRGT